MNITKAVPVLIVTMATSLGAAQHAPHGADAPSTLVAKVREATQIFTDIERARAAGYVELPGCVSGPDHGAMGVHYVRPDLIGDGEIDISTPEALVYEPKDGKLRLVAAEYIVPTEDWKAHHPGDEGSSAPVREGQTFQFVGSPNRFGLPDFYELHVWAWRDNPNGSFVDWNNDVSCNGR